MDQNMINLLLAAKRVITATETGVVLGLDMTGQSVIEELSNALETVVTAHGLTFEEVTVDG